MKDTWSEVDLKHRVTIAHRQLELWEEIALSWPVFLDNSEKQWPYRCNKCGQCIYFGKDPSGSFFLYTGEQELALIVAHIRQCHSEVIDDRPAE